MADTKTTAEASAAALDGTELIRVVQGSSNAKLLVSVLQTYFATMKTALNEAPTVTIASAGSVAVGSAAANTVTISGTSTISAFDTIAAGVTRRVVFSGILTLTHNATSFILPSAANITTAVGDAAEFLSLGSGNWRCVQFTRTNGTALVGSSFTGGTLSSTLNEAPQVAIASAATTDIGAAAGNSISITGTTTITGFGTIASGARRCVVFAGILTLTHNATSLILPSGASITTAAGDAAEFLSLGSGNWKCLHFMRASGAAVVGVFTGGTLTSALNYAPQVTIASASTVAIGAAAANSISVSGTTTITAFDTIASGALRRVVFQGILTLTHNATSLILPSGASITTAAGDVATFESLGAGNWRCVGYSKASGTAVVSAGGLTNFTEAVSTASPNATIPYVSFTATNAATNVDLALRPKGSGALSAHVADSTATGGNKRGSLAVDWQLSRSANSNVAAASSSTISGGLNNEIQSAGTGAAIGGGTSNIAKGVSNVIGGGDSNISDGTLATISGGVSNTIGVSSARCTIGGGDTNSHGASISYATIGGGTTNTTSANSATIGGGNTNTASGVSSTVPGGQTNTASGDYSLSHGRFASTRGIMGSYAHASGRFAATADAQMARYIQRAASTSATVVVASADAGAASTVNTVLLQNASCITFTAMVAARNNATGDAAAFRIVGLIKRGANAAATAIVGTPTVTAVASDSALSAATVAAQANTTNGTLEIALTGIAATNLRWVVAIETSEVAG